MSDGLKAQHRAAIIAALAANDRVERAVLFGSRAMGTNTITSDVDIALFGDRLTLTDQAHLAATCDDLPMAQSVDLVLHNTIDNPALVEHIRSYGVEWYRRGGEDNNSSEMGRRAEQFSKAKALSAPIQTKLEEVGAWRNCPVVRLEKLASNEPGSIAIGPFGSRMKSDVYTPFGVPVIRGTNISASRAWKNNWVYVSNDFADGLPNCNAREGDLVFPHRGSIGEVAIVPGDKPRYMISTSLMKFRPDLEKVSSLFLFYYFRSDFGRNEIMMYSSQVGTPGIGQPLTSLRQFRVVLPPKEEQEHIAKILSVLDDKIEINRRMNETLEAMTQAIFKDWFVDFGPVRAKVEGREAYLPEDVWGLFPDSFQESELGEIPRGWTEKRLDRLFDVSIGRTPPRKEQHHFLPGGHGETWLSIKTMGNVQCFATASDEDLTLDAVKRFRVPRIPSGTVLVSFKLTVGRVAIAAKDMYSNEAIAHLRSRSDTPISSYFTYCYMKEFDYDKLGSTSSIATAINSKQIKTIELMLPLPTIHSAFEVISQPIFDRILKNSHEIDTLTNIRNLILPKLLTGEIRFTDVEQTLETIA